MFRAIACCFVLTLSIARAEERPTTIRVTTADGKPAVGAKAWVQKYGEIMKDIVEPTPLVTDGAGKGIVPGAKKANQFFGLFIRDASGRVGSAPLNRARFDPDDDSVLNIVLLDTIARSGRVTNSEGKAIAGAVVTASGYFAEAESNRRDPQPPSWISFPEWETATAFIKTDTDGRFKLPAPKAGYSVVFRVTAKGFGVTNWSAPAGFDLDVSLLDPGALTIGVAGVEPAVLKNRSWRLNAVGVKTAPGIRPVLSQAGTFDGTAKVTLPFVPPGRYELQIFNDGKTPAIFEKGAPVAVVAGKGAILIAKFGPSAKVSCKITDPDGKALAGVGVSMNVTDGSSSIAHISGETDAQGNYTGYGPGGWYSPNAGADGFATPLPPKRDRPLIEPVKVDVGNSHSFPDIALLKAVTFAGQILFADAKLAPGAEIDIGMYNAPRNEGKTKADNDGRFAVPNLPPYDSVSPRVRLGKAVNVPETIVLANIAPPLTIEIGEANAAAFRGRVLDSKGVAIAGAKVVLLQQFPFVGRSAGMFTDRTVATAATDAKGAYEFIGMWPKDRYRVEASVSGYSKVESKMVLGVAGTTADIAELKLARTSLSVGGIVVGPDGKPLAGVELFSVDGPERFSVKSAADGTFTLAGFSENGGFALAKLAGYRLGMAPVSPGSTQKLRIALSKSDAAPAPLPTILPEHTAALDRIARHSLTLVFQSHAQFGYGGNAVGDMARLDLATAKRWRDEEKIRTEGKTDFTHLIERVERDGALFALAQKDPDAALAKLNPLKSQAGFYETAALAERLLTVDKAKSLPFAELAIVMAGRQPLPDRNWCLARAGDLARRAGGENTGRKAVGEAAELTRKFGEKLQPWETLAQGIAASYLYSFDPDRADAMLKRLTEPGDFNRFLGATAGRVARTDLAKAIELLGEFKPDNTRYPQTARIRVASAIASDKPDEALKLIEGIKEEPYRVLGYLRLAVRYSPTDKKRAWKMIEAAFETLERDPESFFSFSNYCGRAGMAAVVAVRAAEFGYPHTAELVARCLAMRTTVRDWDRPDTRDQQTVGVAAAIALIDPATARQLLRGLGNTDEYITKAASQQREWFFALALADPDGAKKLADTLLDSAKRSPNRLGGTGLVELGSILTAPDRLKVLLSFASLPREIGDDD